MNSLGVSIYLSSILLLAFFAFRKTVGKGASIKVLFWLLLLMVTPGFIMDLQVLFFWGEVRFENMTRFIILLLLTAIPWVAFDKWFKTISSIHVTDRGASVLSTIFVVVIISCLFSYVYIFPYALKSFAMGAADTRAAVNSAESVMPATMFTTFAVGVSTISPFYIFFFFLSWLHPALKKYSFWLFICSFIYIVVSMPFMARDGFVTLPVFYIIFYLVFKNSFDLKSRKKVRRYFTVIASVAGAMILLYSVSRFFDARSSERFYRFIGGTWGYLFQQPYVFDRTLIYQHDWHGVGLRFPILSILFGTPAAKVMRTQDFETMFGTMLSEFYSVGGYRSLYIFTFAFILIYYLGLRILIRRKNYFSIFLLFITYLMIEVTGLFYYRYGGMTFNWLFLVLTLLPFFLSSQILTVKR